MASKMKHTKDVRFNILDPTMLWKCFIMHRLFFITKSMRAYLFLFEYGHSLLTYDTW